MKKLIALSVVLIGVMTLSACDLIEDEIERAQSIELEDVAVLLHEQSVLLKITSDADEQVIEDVVVNDEEYELISQGDDWYLLEEVPIAENYVIGDIYYRTEVGVRLSFDVDYEFDLDDGLNRIPQNYLHPLEETMTIDDFTFSPSDDDLIGIESDQNYDTESLSDWVLLVTQDDEPLFIVLEHEETTYVIEAPDGIDEYIE